MITIILPDGYKIEAEIAATDAARRRGLAGRPSIPEDHGMLFCWWNSSIRQNDGSIERSMWMRGMLFSIDIIWIGYDGVSRVVNSAPVGPCYPESQYSAPACYVLEVVAGQASKHGVVKGAQLRF